MSALLFLLPVIIAVTLVVFPAFWVNVFVIVDFYTPWVLFDSPLYDAYHNFLLSQLPDREPIPLREIPASEASYEKIVELTEGFSFPLIIRGLLGKDSEGVKNWGNPEWWIQNYGNEELLCGHFTEDIEDCTVKGFFESAKNGKPFYVTGASQIFDKHPELFDMIDSPGIRAIEPTNRTATQIFIGLPGMGSDIHSAIGVNIFRQVAGSKKWWFIPTNQTMYLKPSININGFSAHTRTTIGMGGKEATPNFKKLLRYTSVVNPGDVLINPPWFWHGIENMGEPGSLIIGSPVRYGGSPIGKKAAFKNNLLYSANAYIAFYQKYGLDAFKPGFKFNMQTAIANNRRKRNNKELEEEKPTTTQEELHPFDRED